MRVVISKALKRLALAGSLLVSTALLFEAWVVWFSSWKGESNFLATVAGILVVWAVSTGLGAILIAANREDSLAYFPKAFLLLSICSFGLLVAVLSALFLWG